ncbi:MAG: sirohydrochlorin cobaltochelatase [Desulfuromonas thiophila]|nr:sirohydrochlorin cobaltochelatase [Desulfuromonas thiophila]
MRILTLAMTIFIFIGATMSTTFANTTPNSTQRPSIVLVAFGTSVDEARQVFDFIDTQARQRYPDHNIQWAFTSQIIINKLKQRGIITHTVAEVVADLRARGVKKIALQSLHVVPGQEHNSILKADTSGLQVVFGDPLLTSDADIEATIAALAPEINADQDTVVVAHGNDHHPEFNVQLEKFATAIEARYPQLTVASVEGTPGTDSLETVKARQPEQVHFVPLMIVAGDHIMNDVLGDEEDSWKNIIQAPVSSCSRSLGWNPAILAIYFEHLDHALAELSGTSCQA